MIMVTHDVALKCFANRVVRMVDGKVHKIVTMPSDKRREEINKLNQRVEAILSGDDRGALTVREGTQEDNSNSTVRQIRQIPENFASVVDARTATKTTVRKPSDYPVLRERFSGQTPAR